MAKQRGQRKGSSGWLKQQAAVERKAREQKVARITEQQARETQAKDALTKLIQQTVSQQARLQRLAVAFADRCYRVTELYKLLRQEWERAERAEARVKELEAELRGKQTPAKAPARKATAPRPGARPTASRNGQAKKTTTRRVSA